MFFGEQIEFREQLCGVFHAARIVGRDQNNGPCARGNEPCGALQIGQKVCPGRKRNSAHPGHVAGHFVIEIPRRWENNLISRLSQCRECRGEGLVASCGDGYICGVDGALIVFGPQCSDFRPKLGQS